MKTDGVPAVLVDQQQALDAYFDALFHNTQPKEASAPVPAGQTSTRRSDPVQEHPSEPDSLPVQLFTVAGLKLAVPLERVESMLSSQAGLTTIADDTGLVLGTVTCNGKVARVVDTARLLLPPERAGKLPTDKGAQTRHVLILDDGEWALACSHIEDIAGLAKNEITWRTAAGKRPWLAGMVPQRGCALLDVDGLLQLLEGSVA